MMTPPFNISARPRFTGYVPVARGVELLEVMPLAYRHRDQCPKGLSGSPATCSDQPGNAVVESTRASSTHVRPGVSWIGSPLSAVNV